MRTDKSKVNAILA